MLPSYEIDRSYLESEKTDPRVHRDRHVQYSHEMSDETAEASSRTLIRIVPLVYGALLGGLIDDILLGVSLGMVLSIALDSRMGRQSLSLGLLRPLVSAGCPAISAIARGLALALRFIGLRAPLPWRDMRCEASDL